jgi:hypothetical protein
VIGASGLTAASFRCVVWSGPVPARGQAGPPAVCKDQQTRRSSSSLAVDDLDRSLAFYRKGLGWPTEGIVGQEVHDEVTGSDVTIAIVTLDDGLLLTLYERTNWPKTPACLPGRPVPPSSAWAFPPSAARRSTDCSPKPRPPAAR